MMEKNSFIFYTDYMKHLDILDMEQRGVLITALASYQLRQELPEMDKVTAMAFSFISQDMDINDKKYEERAEKAKKAAQARWNEHKQAKPSNTKPMQKDAKVCKDMPKDTKECVYFDDEELNKTFSDYVDMRKKIKAPMTEQAIKLAKSSLHKLSGGSKETALLILEQSIMNSWKGLFALKEDKPKNKFNNYEGREYDKTDLEKKFLGVI